MLWENHGAMEEKVEHLYPYNIPIFPVFVGQIENKFDKINFIPIVVTMMTNMKSKKIKVVRVNGGLSVSIYDLTEAAKRSVDVQLIRQLSVRKACDWLEDFRTGDPVRVSDVAEALYDLREIGVIDSDADSFTIPYDDEIYSIEAELV